MPTHEFFMQRAIELANKATGCTSPNPLVGAVIVRDNTIVAEGWHKQAGQAHAEVDAINNARANGVATEGTTIYVSLEPCSHTGKTPPCTQAILNAGISHLVYATKDTNSQASGGAEVLAAAGVDVVGPVCEQEAKELNRFFFHFQNTGTPFVIAKVACSLDGRTATRTGHSQWITGTKSRERGHVARQEVDAIIVGAQTAIADQPQLTVRNPAAFKHATAAHPLRVVLDSTGRVPLDNSLFDSSLPGNTLVVTTNAMPAAHETALTQNNIDVMRLPCTADSHYPDCKQLLQALAEKGIQSVLVEGGHTVIGSFLDHGLINEMWTFIAPVLIGGTEASPSIGGLGFSTLDNAPRLTNVSIEQLDSDILVKGSINNAGNHVHQGA